MITKQSFRMQIERLILMAEELGRLKEFRSSSPDELNARREKLVKLCTDVSVLGGELASEYAEAVRGYVR